MLACIACSSEEGGEDGSRGAVTPHGKYAVKSLTSQLKDMVLKFSSSGKQYRAGIGSPSFRGRSYRRPYPGFIDDTTFPPVSRPAGVDGCVYTTAAAAGIGSGGSTRAAASPATWDMTTRSNRGWPSIEER